MPSKAPPKGDKPAPARRTRKAAAAPAAPKPEAELSSGAAAPVPAPADAAPPRRVGWLAAGVGSAALVAALLYATRGKRNDWTK